MGEDFPDLLDADSFFKTFVVKDISSSDGREGVSYNASYAVHKRCARLPSPPRSPLQPWT